MIYCLPICKKYLMISIGMLSLHDIIPSQTALGVIYIYIYPELAEGSTKRELEGNRWRSLVTASKFISKSFSKLITKRRQPPALRQDSRKSRTASFL